MQHANDGDFRIQQKIVDQVGADGMFEITFADMDATPDFQTGRQSLEGFDDFCMVGFRLLCGPVLDGISPDVFKISPASGDRPYFRGLFAICRAHPPQECGVIEGGRLSGFLTSNQCILKSPDLRFMLFKQTQTCAKNIAGRAVSARLNLSFDKGAEMITKRNGCVAGHVNTPMPIPT
jgi:hypothetical protein